MFLKQSVVDAIWDVSVDNNMFVLFCRDFVDVGIRDSYSAYCTHKRFYNICETGSGHTLKNPVR